MMKTLKAGVKIGVAAVCLLVAGCATAPVRMNKISEGHWSGRALVKDKKKNSTYIVDLDINARRDRVLRMDVTTTLGTGVASLVVNSNQVRYLLFDSHRFYFGHPNIHVMRPILSVPLDPRWLSNIMFETPIQDKGWTCTQDKDGFLAECRDALADLTITWSGRSGAKRTILIEHPSASVQINVSAFQPKVEVRPHIFALKAPEGFHKFRVR